MDVKPEELHGCPGGYRRLTGTPFAPLTCCRLQPEDVDEDEDEDEEQTFSRARMK